MIQLRDEHRRHAEDHRAPVLLYRLECAQWVELGDSHNRCGMRIRAQYADNTTETVEERNLEKQLVRAAHSDPGTQVKTVPENVVMAQHHALRKSRSAGRVLHVDALVWV